MLTRRAFLVGAAGLTTSVASGLILPAWLERAERFVADEDAPLLEPPAVEKVTINAVRFDGVDDIRLVIGDPFEEPPQMTWQGFFEHFYGDDFDSFEEFVAEWFVTPMRPTDEADSCLVLDTWLARGEAPDTLAYAYLEPLDIGPELGAGSAAGRIDFVNGPCPGNDSRFVSVPDLLSLSLLQKRLNQIDGTTLVRLVDAA